MANCSAGPASCKTSCPGGCACVYEHETQECYCERFEVDDVISGNLSLSAVVSLTVSGLSLGHVADRLDRLMKREVLVPASRSKETIKVEVEKGSAVRGDQTTGTGNTTITQKETAPSRNP